MAIEKIWDAPATAGFIPWSAGDKRPLFPPGVYIDIQDAEGNLFENHHPDEGVFWGRGSNIVGYRIQGLRNAVI